MSELIIESGGGRKVTVTVGGFTIATDQAVISGGEGSAPEPFTLFLASIGSCAGIYVYSFCEARGIPTEGIVLKQRVNFNPEKRMVDKIDIEIQLSDDFPEKYRKAVIRSASLCAVKKHLMDPPEFTITTTKPGERA